MLGINEGKLGKTVGNDDTIHVHPILQMDRNIRQCETKTSPNSSVGWSSCLLVSQTCVVTPHPSSVKVERWRGKQLNLGLITDELFLCFCAGETSARSLRRNTSSHRERHTYRAISNDTERQRYNKESKSKAGREIPH